MRRKWDQLPSCCLYGIFFFCHWRCFDYLATVAPTRSGCTNLLTYTQIEQWLQTIDHVVIFFVGALLTGWLFQVFRRNSGFVVVDVARQAVSAAWLRHGRSQLPRQRLQSRYVLKRFRFRSIAARRRRCDFRFGMMTRHSSGICRSVCRLISGLLFVFDSAGPESRRRCLFRGRRLDCVGSNPSWFPVTRQSTLLFISGSRAANRLFGGERSYSGVDDVNSHLRRHFYDVVIFARLISISGLLEVFGRRSQLYVLTADDMLRLVAVYGRRHVLTV